MTEIGTPLLPTSNVSPTDDGVMGSPVADNIGWSGNPATALNAVGGSAISINFDENPDDDAYAAFQVVLNGNLEPSKDYIITVSAKEAGTGQSWGNAPINVTLTDKNGVQAFTPLPDNYLNFWGGDTGQTLTGSYKSFNVSVSLAATGGNGGWTPNTLVFWVFPPANRAATKQLYLDFVKAEEVQP